jgi:thiol-disulfide isomerase/thioredoxin
MKNKAGIKKHWLLLVVIAVLFCLSSGEISAHENDITEEELAAFRVTLYSPREQILLERLFTIDGTPYNSGVLRGNYAMVNFWTTWCPYCRQESPSVNRLNQNQAVEWFTILTISLGEKTETVTNYINGNGFDFPVVFNPENELRNIYAPRIPTTYIIDPEGYIVARINGSKEWDDEQALRILRFLIPNMTQ